jgi:hypothetical protein
MRKFLKISFMDLLGAGLCASRPPSTPAQARRPPIAESELGDAQYYRLPARRVEVTAV